RYGAFGEPVAAEGPLAARFPFRWAARYQDPATGLLYHRAREYDPRTARFLTPDPAGWLGGLNPYAYAGNDPLNHDDPSGLLPHIVIGALVGAVLGAGTSVAISLLNGERPNWKDVVATTVAGAAIGGLFAGTAGMAIFAKSALAKAALWGGGGGMATGLEEVVANLLHRRPWHHHVASSAGLGVLTGLSFWGLGNVFGRVAQAFGRRFPHAGVRGGGKAILLAKGKILLAKAKLASAMLMDNVVIFTKSLLSRGGAKPAHGAGRGAAAAETKAVERSAAQGAKEASGTKSTQEGVQQQGAADEVRRRARATQD
ncbi:MAG TPA: hypothetical protein DEA08_26865, partial [Planctomycetes bacterium]|nr:hypothetical protein [Planctomycetota bacterium]